MTDKQIITTDEAKINRMLLNTGVNNFEDIQKIRLAFWNRIRDIVRKTDLGIPLDQVEPKKTDEEKRAIEAKYSDKKLPGIVANLHKKGVITRAFRDRYNAMIEHAKQMRRDEYKINNEMAKLVAKEIAWTGYLSGVKGVAETLAARLIHALGDCETFDSVSAVWRYFGYHLVCPECTEETYNEVRKENKTIARLANNEGFCPECGKRAIAPKGRKGVSSDWNPNSRKLGWMIADCLMKTRSPVFRDVYDEVKEKEHSLNESGRTRNVDRGLVGMMVKGSLLGKEKDSDQDKFFIVKQVDLQGVRLRSNGEEVQYKLTDGHIDNRAKRKIAKLFLATYWDAVRRLTGQSVTKPYVESEMGHKDIITPELIFKKNFHGREFMRAA
jgi:ribosomal protein L33